MVLRVGRHDLDAVSVLFSEPKIPQWRLSALRSAVKTEFQCSSASRKFLNCCDCATVWRLRAVSVLFSEPKIPQFRSPASPPPSPRGFSALQRAENSSIKTLTETALAALRFQCSSASRKFLNRRGSLVAFDAERRFSALQRAENSSIALLLRKIFDTVGFSALQRAENSSMKVKVL